MNYFISKGKLNGKWSNGLSGSKRGLNLIIIDEAVAYKTSVWQEDADKLDEELSVGDEVYLFGQAVGFWKKDGKPVGIEIVEPEIQKISSYQDLKADLISHLNKNIE